MATQVYKGVVIQKGLPLWHALEARDMKLAKKLFDETTKKYETQYSEEDRNWFAKTAKEFHQKFLDLHAKECDC